MCFDGFVWFTFAEFICFGFSFAGFGGFCCVGCVWIGFLIVCVIIDIRGRDHIVVCAINFVTVGAPCLHHCTASTWPLVNAKDQMIAASLLFSGIIFLHVAKRLNKHASS